MERPDLTRRADNARARRAPPPDASRDSESPGASARRLLAFILVFVLLSLGVGTAGFVYYAHQKSQLRQTEFRELSAIADLRAQQIAAWRKELLADAEISSRDLFAERAICDWLADPDPRLGAKIGAWLRLLRETRPYWSVLLLDGRGNVRLSVPEGMTVDPHVLEDMLRAPPGGDPVLSDFHRTGPERKIVLSLFAPVLSFDDPGARTVGFLVFTIDPGAFLYPLLHRWPTLSPSGETLLVERQGEEVVYLNELRHRKGTALVLRLPLSTAELPAAHGALGRTGTFEGIDYRGEPVLAAYRPVPGTPWELVAKVDAREAYARLAQSALLLGAAVGALVLSGAAVILFLIARESARGERRVAEAIREREARFASFMLHLPAAAWIKDLQGRYVYANVEAERVFSTPFPELRGKTDDDVFSPETAREFRQNDRRALDEGGSIQATERFRQADGIEHVSLVNKFVIPGPTGLPAQIGGVAFDVTQRLEAEERFRAIFDHAGVGIVEAARDDRFIAVNDRICQILGYTREELLAMNVHELTAPEDRPLSDEMNRQVHEGRSDRVAYEKRYLKRDGTPLWVYVNVSAVRDARGRWLRSIATVEDISAGKAAEARLRESEERFRTLADNIAQLAWMADEKGRIFWYNRRWYEYTGMTLSEMEGRGWRKVNHPDHVDRVVKKIRRCFSTGEAWEDTFPLRRKDGEYRWFLSQAIPIRDEQGNVLRWFGTNTDVTEQREAADELAKAREAAEAASRAKSEFLANMSHEIRTPMAGVLGMTELLLDTEVTPAQRQYLKMVQSSADALLTVINDILDFSRIEAGRLEIDNVEFGLREVVEKAAEAVAVRAHEKGLELVAFVEPELADRHVGDPGRLRQVLLNLLGNAIKFTGAGEVVLAVEPSPEAPSRPDSCRLRFSVRDTGIGIPKERQGELFHPFSQLDASLARAYGGTGLGLSISKRIVESIGGRIWVESQEGKGSTFFFEVDLAVDREGGPCEVPPPADLAGRRALVLEDNATNQNVLVRTLESRGMEVGRASRCSEAVEKLLSAARGGRSFEVALLDLHLPDGDGFSVVETVRREISIADLAIMMITSDEVPGGARRCRDLGVGAYLVKPVRMGALQETVGKLLGARLAALGPEPATALLTAQPPPEIPEGLRVLVAEDNPVNRTFVEAILGRRGISVTSVPDGREALRALEDREFDIVLMDIQMPEMDGYEATRELRNRGLRVPVVGLTAHALVGDRERCLAAGMDDYLPKPVSPETLYRKLAAWAKGCPGVCPGEEPEPPADLGRLRQTLKGDRTVIAALIGQFRATSEELLPEIERAARDKNSARLEAAAHKLRGGLALFEARDAVALAEELDHLGREKRTEGSEALAAELTTAVRRLLRYLDREAPAG